jgi:hypothetical protein
LKISLQYQTSEGIHRGPGHSRHVSQFPTLESGYPEETEDVHTKKSTNNISQFVITAGLSTEEQGSYDRVLLYAEHSVLLSHPKGQAEKLCKSSVRFKNLTTARIRTVLKLHTFGCPTAGSEGSCDWPTQPFSAFFVTANAELAPKIHDAMHSSYAGLPKLTSKFPPKHSCPHVIKISA